MTYGSAIKGQSVRKSKTGAYTNNMASGVRGFPNRSIVYILIIIVELLPTCFSVVPTNKFQIEGKVIAASCRLTSLPDESSDCFKDTRVLVDGGTYLGFPRSDGSFVVSNVPPGSYIVEVSHPVDTFDRFRVDVNSRGKIRARLLDLVQQSAARGAVYPLRFKVKQPADYFQKRDAQKWYLNKEILMYLPMLLFPLLFFGMMKSGVFPDQNEILPAIAQLVEPFNRRDAMSTWSLPEIVMWLLGDARPESHEERRVGRNSRRRNASRHSDRTSETSPATAEALNGTASAATSSQQPKGSRAKRPKRQKK